MSDRLDGQSSHPGRGPEPAPRPPPRPIDDVDRRLLFELGRDARLSVRALAERVGTSRSNAYARLDRLVGEGVIRGFGVRLDPDAAGLGTSAYVMVQIEQNSWRQVAGRLRRIPYVEHLALVAGDVDVLVLVRAPDNTALRHVVLEEIQGIPTVRSTRTWLVFDEVAGPGPWPAG
ncbi:MAG: Lrp/AsnC family transcriptional regulator [Acidimicrobiales bacterium]